jgi:chromosome segregation ATPase
MNVTINEWNELRAKVAQLTGELESSDNEIKRLQLVNQMLDESDEVTTLKAKVAVLERELKERGVDIQDLTSALTYAREDKDVIFAENRQLTAQRGVEHNRTVDAERKNARLAAENAELKQKLEDFYNNTGQL